MKTVLSLLLAIAGAVFGFPAFGAEIEVPVVAGARNQQVEITFRNPTGEDVKEIEISINASPAWATNVTLSKREIESLGKNESVKITLYFDVVEEAGAAISGAITLGFSFEDTDSRLDTDALSIVGVLEEAEEEEAVADSTDPDESDQDPAAVRPDQFVYRLLSVEAEDSTFGINQHIPGASGMSNKSIQGAMETVTAVNCPNCPQTIVLGESFDFLVEAEQRINYKRVACSSGLKGTPGPVPELFAKKYGHGTVSGISEPRLSKPTCEELGVEKYAECTDEVQREMLKNSRVQLCGSEGPDPNRSWYDRHPKVDYSFDQQIAIKHSYRFTGVSSTDSDCREFRYEISNQVNSGRLEDNEGGTVFSVCFGWGETQDAPKQILDESKILEFTIGGGYGELRFRYGLDIDGTTAGISLTAFSKPEELLASPLEPNPEYDDPYELLADAEGDSSLEDGDATEDGGATREPNEGREAVASDEDVTPESERVADQTAGPTGPAQGPNPKDPKIAALIAQWTSEAEPPSNATHGNDFRYEEWGRFVGTNADGGIVSVNRKPDDVGGQSSPEYLWARKDQLDSVDHCTLGEFVTAKLVEQPLEHCRARYKPIMPALAGMSVENASRRLEVLRLKPELMAGTQAQSPEESGTVERQAVKSGVSLDRGQSVVIWVHTHYVDQTILPDLVGRRASDARSKVESLGLLAQLSIGDMAPSESLNGTIQRQLPESGAALKAGETIQLVVYSAHVESVTVPAVEGLIASRAKAELESAGFTTQFVIGDSAPEQSRSGTVQHISPKGGTTAMAGAPVTVTVYSDFINQAVVPNVVGIDKDGAIRTLEQSGFQVVVVQVATDRSKSGNTSGTWNGRGSITFNTYGQSETVTFDIEFTVDVNGATSGTIGDHDNRMPVSGSLRSGNLDLYGERTVFHDDGSSDTLSVMLSGSVSGQSIRGSITYNTIDPNCIAAFIGGAVASALDAITGSTTDEPEKCEVLPFSGDWSGTQSGATPGAVRSDTRSGENRVVSQSPPGASVAVRGETVKISVPGADNASGTELGSHPCLTLRSNYGARDATWDWYSFMGVGGSNGEIGGFICTAEGYYTYQNNRFRSFDCGKDYASRCTETSDFSARITQIKEDGKGSVDYSYQYPSGKSGMGKRTPNTAKQAVTNTPSSSAQTKIEHRDWEYLPVNGFGGEGYTMINGYTEPWGSYVYGKGQVSSSKIDVKVKHATRAIRHSSYAADDYGSWIKVVWHEESSSIDLQEFNLHCQINSEPYITATHAYHFFYSEDRYACAGVFVPKQPVNSAIKNLANQYLQFIEAYALPKKPN